MDPPIGRSPDPGRVSGSSAEGPRSLGIDETWHCTLEWGWGSRTRMMPRTMFGVNDPTWFGIPSHPNIAAGPHVPATWTKAASLLVASVRPSPITVFAIPRPLFGRPLFARPESRCSASHTTVFSHPESLCSPSNITACAHASIRTSQRGLDSFWAADFGRSRTRS